ncbi:hypothetical protein DLAC_04078 [Tieghemostelium lacteum]|uniref:Uncharacterized protein n=1 Tax=Tieghemostelium lacteum TaxID=361077 RepID=A0A151ZS68_TIELA|nr:hypothetical protein DLAC_04078 [Tieghemostelium lacteum]|eukprot:KYQ96778.1 hypothetical protein DLAC_04078 [Tieghemostelium lacteum]
METDNQQELKSKSDPIPIPGSNSSVGSMENSPKPSRNTPQYSGSPFDIKGIIYSLSNWLRGIEEKEFDPEEYREREKDLWTDWEWILSTTEEFLLKQNQSETQKVLGELDTLKKTASNLKIKPIFINRASEIIKTLSEQDLETLRQSLDSSKRLGVINTVINQMESQWLNYIQDQYFKNEINSSHSFNSPSLNAFSPPVLKGLENLNINSKSQPSPSSTSNINTSNNTVDQQQQQSNNQIESLSIEEGWEENNLKSPLFKSSKPAPPILKNVIVSSEQQHENKDSNSSNSKGLNDSSSSIAADMIVLNKNINKITWDQFLENFRGQKYQKGLHTRMKDIGWQASHGVDGTLNARVMGDISWSIWNTLCTGLKQIREITYDEQIQLTEKVNVMQPLLIQIWINTIRNSSLGSKNEGLVVEKWKEQEITHKLKIQELKRSGKLDKYSPEKIKILDHEKKEISSIRSTLEQKLKLKSR